MPASRLPFSKPWLALYAALAALAVVGVLFVGINTTPSVPPGIYLRLPLGGRTLRPGDDVFVCMPPGPAAELALERGYIPRGVGCASGGIPLLKHVAAVAGETVVADSTGAFVGRRRVGLAPPTRDRLGQPLQPRLGRWTLAPGQIWLGSDIPNGYDSRYLGPVDARFVLRRARLLFRV